MMMTMTDVPSANPELTVRDIGDETIILSRKGDMLHTLNSVGAFLWRNVDGRKSLQEILAALIREYEVSEATAREDLLRFFEELEGKGLLGCPKKNAK